MTIERDALDRLMEDVLEARATAADVARLRAHLEQDPAARERFAAEERAVLALRALPLADAPADLRAAVMREVGARARAPRREGLLASLGAALRRRPALGLGLGLAGGAVLGALALTVIAPQRGLRTVPGPVEGTMAAPDARTWPTVRRVLSAGRARVEIVPLVAPGRVTLVLSGQAVPGTQLRLELAATAGRIALLEPPRGSRAALEGETLVLSLEAEVAGRVGIALERDSRVRVQLVAGTEQATDEIELHASTRGDPRR